MELHSTHLHDRIARATTRLAQLQAQELVASQRKASRARAQAKREDALRRKRVAELVFATGSQSLDDEEIVAALLRYREECREVGARAEAKRLGETYLSACRSQNSPLGATAERPVPGVDGSEQ